MHTHSEELGPPEASLGSVAGAEMPRLQRWIPGLATALLSLAAGAASLWVITEQDIYWQVRAGLELWDTHSWPSVDSWSFSAAGKPWMNLQWLSTLLFAAAFALGEETGLIVLRGLLVAGLMALVGATLVAQGRRRGTGAVTLSVCCLLPLLYAALTPRLQLRSDFLVLMTFAALRLLWAADARPVWQRWGTPVAVLLAANLHAGVAPFVVLAAGSLLAENAGTAAHPWRPTLAAMVASGLAFLATPYHVRVIPWAWAHVHYYAHSLMRNPDHQPLSWGYLQANSGIAWLILAGSSSLMWLLPTTRPGPWERRLPGLAAALVLIALSIDRTRAIPYHAVFTLPVVASGLQLLPAALSAAPALVVSLALGVTAVRGMLPLWGFGVSQTLFPVGSTRFLAAQHPAPNVLHTFAYGAYLVWYLRDYPLYVDTRETMYWDLQAEILNAYHSPEITQGIIRKYGVHTTLMPIPKTQYIPGAGFRDLIGEYMPAESWAVVYFDAISFVAVERLPQHAALIGEHEYQLLRPNLPANVYVNRPQRTNASDAQYAREIARCRSDEPTNAFCKLAQVSFWRAVDPLSYHLLGEALLLEAQGAFGSDSPQRLTLLLELQSLYTSQGFPGKAAAIDAQLGPGTVVQQ